MSSTPAERRLWQCPNCTKRYQIPADSDPDLCRECLDSLQDVAAPDAMQTVHLSDDDRLLLRNIAEAAMILKWCGIFWLLGAALFATWMVMAT